MNRRSPVVRVWSALAIVGLAVAPLACDYSTGRPRPNATRGKKKADPAQIAANETGKPAAAGKTAASGEAAGGGLRSDVAEQKERSEAILSNVITIIRSAGTNPGGDHFKIATDNLNRYFEKSSRPTDFSMKTPTRKFLATQLAEGVIRDSENPTFNETFDCRHLEDCMLYNEVANRVAGEGDDLTRVRRLFDWMVRNVQLVPVDSLAMTTGQQNALRAEPGFNPKLAENPYFHRQAQARPYDVLLRGMGTEDAEFGSERGWLFMALCRQIGVDVGLLTYMPRQAPAMLARPESGGPVVWVCAALIGDKAYLFDQRLGIAVPDAEGKGVATLEEAMTDPRILDRLNLPGQASYSTRRSDLLASSEKIGVLVDSSPGYFAPKMRLLQGRLVGKDRTILYRDPLEQYEAFARAVGPRMGAFRFWTIPLQVHYLLFTDSMFVKATQVALARFDGKYPLLYARMAQLKGQTADAIEQYVKLRFTTSGLQRNGKDPIPPDVQRELDVYATLFLAECHLDQNNPSQAKLLFEQLLKITPAPTRDREEKGPMFRWGAQTNLGLLARDRKDVAAATRYLSQPDPTPQHSGNLLNARDLLWADPMAPIAPAVAPPPKDPSAQQAVMNR